MKKVINSLLDNDLYTFSVCYAYLEKFPRAIGRYTFVDRNHTVYPAGFADLLKEQIDHIGQLRFADDELDFLQSKCSYFPNWFFTFLRGFKMDPSEVSISQDAEGHLIVTIEGPLWRTVFWEMPILSTVSELMHKLNGDQDTYNSYKEYRKTYDKARMMIEAGVRFSDFGTRRRFSFEHQDTVIDALKCASDDYLIETGCKSTFSGTSNVYFAKKYNLTPIGTMSHQFIETCSLFGYNEANYIAMDYWQECYQGDLGIFLYDTYTRKAFFENFTELHAKLFDGLRVDSGDNIEALEDIIRKYEELGINPAHKTIVFSNALSYTDAIELHKKVNGRMMDSYGIGTNLTCDVDNVKPMNIVIKLTAAKITEKRQFKDVIKLSDDYGKYTGNPEEIEIAKHTLGIK